MPLPKGIFLLAIAALLTGCAGGFAGGGAAGDPAPPSFAGPNAQYTELRPARAAKPTPILTGAGETIDLSRFRGKVVILNFWATWCPPCVEEMPSLDRLAAEMAGEPVAVVAVAIDKDGREAVPRFFRRHGLQHLKIYLDPDGRTAYRDANNPNNAAFALYGLPVTYILDHRGRAMGYIPGPADWQSEAARALIRHYTGRIGS